MKRLLFFCFLACTAWAVNAQNPYLPLWEHVPDGEPRVFEDPDHPGKLRAYIIGSRATQKCILQALLEPVAKLREYEANGQSSERLALMEEAKAAGAEIAAESLAVNGMPDDDAVADCEALGKALA